MIDDNNTYDIEGDALVNDEGTTDDVQEEKAPLSIEDYLYSTVNFDVPEETIVRILLERDVECGSPAMEVPKQSRDLCKADLYVWIVMGVSRRGTVTDTDNGWTHSDGGYTLTEADKSYFIKAANTIYEKYGEDTVGKTKFKFTSHGIQPARYIPGDIPLPHIIR